MSAPTADNGGSTAYRTRQRDRRIAWGAVVLAVLALIVVIGINSGDDGDSGPPLAERVAAAEIACEEFVKDRLKAPATAEFPQPQTTAGAVYYMVKGVVDSENSFSAKIRSAYACEIRLNEADGVWTLVSLDIR